MRFTPGSAICIISDVRGNAPSSRYAIESRVDRVERLVGVKRVWVLAEDAADERRSASLIRQDDDVFRCDLSLPKIPWSTIWINHVFVYGLTTWLTMVKPYPKTMVWFDSITPYPKNGLLKPRVARNGDFYIKVIDDLSFLTGLTFWPFPCHQRSPADFVLSSRHVLESSGAFPTTGPVSVTYAIIFFYLGVV